MVEGLQAAVQASGRSWYEPDTSVPSHCPSRCPHPRWRSSPQRGRAGAAPSGLLPCQVMLAAPTRRRGQDKLRTLSAMLPRLCTAPRSSKTKTEPATADARPQGIFGVPLRQSITYANVAISLVDENGKSYIYGYVPIVVAKCGVFLKEKGRCCHGCVERRELVLIDMQRQLLG